MSHANLILSSQSYSMETVWMEGYAHGSSEAHQSIRCPYPEKSNEEFHWQEGWDAGFYGDEALFKDHAVELPEIPQSVVPFESRKFSKVEKFIYSVGLTVGAAVAVALLAA